MGRAVVVVVGRTVVVVVGLAVVVVVGRAVVVVVGGTVVVVVGRAVVVVVGGAVVVVVVGAAVVVVVGAAVVVGRAVVVVGGAVVVGAFVVVGRCVVAEAGDTTVVVVVLLLVAGLMIVVVGAGRVVAERTVVGNAVVELASAAGARARSFSQLLAAHRSTTVELSVRTVAAVVAGPGRASVAIASFSRISVEVEVVVEGSCVVEVVSADELAERSVRSMGEPDDRWFRIACSASVVLPVPTPALGIGAGVEVALLVAGPLSCPRAMSSFEKRRGPTRARRPTAATTTPACPADAHFAEPASSLAKVDRSPAAPMRTSAIAFAIRRRSRCSGREESDDMGASQSSNPLSLNEPNALHRTAHFGVVRCRLRMHHPSSEGLRYRDLRAFVARERADSEVVSARVKRRSPPCMIVRDRSASDRGNSAPSGSIARDAPPAYFTRNPTISPAEVKSSAHVLVRFRSRANRSVVRSRRVSNAAVSTSASGLSAGSPGRLSS